MWERKLCSLLVGRFCACGVHWELFGRDVAPWGWEESGPWNVSPCTVAVGESHLEGQYRASFCPFEERI